MIRKRIGLIMIPHCGMKGRNIKLTVFKIFLPNIFLSCAVRFG